MKDHGLVLGFMIIYIVNDPLRSLRFRLLNKDISNSQAILYSWVSKTKSLR